MAEKKPFSDEELQGLKQGDFRLTEKFSGEIVANWIDRFLETIAGREEKLKNIESDLEDYKYFVKQRNERIAADRKWIEKLSNGMVERQEIIAEQRKRIEELEKINKVHRDLRPDETGVLKIIELKEDTLRQAATIERLRVENEELQLLSASILNGVPITINWEKARALYKRIKALDTKEEK